VSTAIGAIGVALQFLGLCIVWRDGHNHGNGIAAIGALLAALSRALEGDNVGMGASALCAAFWAWCWWTGGGGKDLKKAVRELGDESRQRVQALVSALQPAPAGA
jgi:hypothetical protein